MYKYFNLYKTFEYIFFYKKKYLTSNKARKKKT